MGLEGDIVDLKTIGNIVIPFPQMDVHLNGAAPGLEDHMTPHEAAKV